MKIIKNFCKVHIAVIFAFMIVGENNSTAISLRAHDSQEKIKVFYTESDKIGWYAMLVGEVVAIGSREDAHAQELLKVVQPNTRVTVRLYRIEGVKKGDFLFVINNRNLVVGRIEVKIIYRDASFGPMLIGYGNYRFSWPGYRVVQKVEENFSKDAYIFKARGDFFAHSGDYGQAIAQYKKAIELDRRYPEAHAALGHMYLKDNSLAFAMKEYEEAYREIGRIYDNEEKFLLLKGMTKVKYKMAYELAISNEKRRQHVKDGIKYATEALAIYPESRDVNLYLARFYFKGPDYDDVKAKNQFLKVLEIDPQNTEAYVALAELYRKHENEEKALYYARRALELDPALEDAKKIIQRLEK
ncbi:MAG: tetratricopeptide repeat protein [Spirochaetes bacterium]|nr:tetratricopeptide repeat protein [Spirochaetota bacterium]